LTSLSCALSLSPFHAAVTGHSPTNLPHTCSLWHTWQKHTRAFNSDKSHTSYYRSEMSCVGVLLTANVDLLMICIK